MDIRVDDLSGDAIRRLLAEHLHGMTLHSPPESIHALDLDALRRPDITFWTAWDGADLAGCGAIRALDASHGEIKSMRTATPYLRRGVAAAMLAHILDEAARRRYARVSLETGSMAAFEPARRLYERFGFEYCAPFGSYVDDPPQVVDHGEIGRVRAGLHEDAILEGEGAEAVLAHVLGREALEERGARGELVATDVGDLEVPGERLADLLRGRQAHPDEGVGKMLPRRLPMRFGPCQLGVREEASRGQPLSKGRGMAGIHGSPNSRRQLTLPEATRGGKQCFP